MIRSFQIQIITLMMILLPYFELLSQTLFYCPADTGFHNNQVVITSICPYYYSFLKSGKDSVINILDDYNLTQIKSELRHNINSKNGSLKIFIRDSILFDECKIVNGKIHGTCKMYNRILTDTGGIIYTIQYKKSKKDGIEKHINWKNNNVSMLIKYRKGKLIKEKRFYEPYNGKWMKPDK